MDLPVEKWKVYVSQKWTSLDPLLKDKLCLTGSLRDSFLQAWALFHPEDEEYLHSLSGSYCVKKDPKIALCYKEEGNKSFLRKEYRTAALLYSKALAHAEGGTTEKAVCYANRSAALFHLSQFEVCLEDIERAEAEGYPERLYPKILLRKAECLLSLGRSQEATEFLDLAKSKMAEGQRLTAHSQQMLLGKFSELRVEACKEGNGLVPQSAAPDGTQQDLEHWEENGKISCASVLVNLSYSTGKGRHLVAAKDILPGEILVREEAFVSVLNPGKSFLCQGNAKATWTEQLDNEILHCHHCLRELVASVPCQGCSYAQYCSSMCAQLAWKSYHQTECALGGLLLTLGVFCHVALRTILVAGFTEVSTLVKRSHGDDAVEPGGKSIPESPTCQAEENAGAASIPGCDADGRYSSSYQAIFSLLPHTEKHSHAFRFLCSLSVVALFKGLRGAGVAASVWGEATSEDQEETKAAEASLDVETLGEAMLRHMFQLQCNAQAVTILRESGSRDRLVVNQEQLRLATALFPVVSLLNHSCAPNTSIAFRSTSAEVRALQTISRGEEIFHCYGPHRSRMGAAERHRRLLSQYFFECQCQSCQDELLCGPRGRTSQHSMFCCPACLAPMQGDGLLCCSNRFCKEVIPEGQFLRHLRDLQQLTETALALLGCGEPDRSVGLLLKCKMDAKKFLSPEHVLVGEIEDHLAQAYASLGKWKEAAEHLRNSVQAVEDRHGSSSVEVGQELFKLAQVLFNGRAVPEALHTIRKAEAVLSTHFGSQNSQVQELQEMKACLEEFAQWMPSNS